MFPEKYSGGKAGARPMPREQCSLGHFANWSGVTFILKNGNRAEGAPAAGRGSEGSQLRKP